MRTRAFCTSIAAALFLMASTSNAQAAAPATVAYVPNWIDTAAFAPTIEYSKLTHINIAFENPGPDGALSFDDKNQILIDMAHKNRVLVLISIGGGAASGDKTLLARYADLLSGAKRAKFVAEIADYVSRHKLDGLDVDLEGPSIGKNYGAFVHDLSRALKPRGKLALMCASSSLDSAFQSGGVLRLVATGVVLALVLCALAWGFGLTHRASEMIDRALAPPRQAPPRQAPPRQAPPRLDSHGRICE